MTLPEQPAQLPEQERTTPELYNYDTVLDALREQHVPYNDIAYIGDVVVRWDETIPPWAHVQDVRRAEASMQPASDPAIEAKKLLAQAAQLLTDEHWDQALEAQRVGSAILESRPGVFILNQEGSGARFVVDTLLLSSDHARSAELYVSGEGQTVSVNSEKTNVYIDATQLTPEEWVAVRSYVAQLELTPVK